MIQRKNSRPPTRKEINGLVQQLYEELLERMKACAGEFSEGMLQNWTNPRVVNRVREMQVRLNGASKQHSPSRIFTVCIAEIKSASILAHSREDKEGAQGFFERKDVDSFDINTYREFQCLKLKAIQVFLKEYGKILAVVSEEATVFKMRQVIIFLGVEKSTLAASMGLSAK
jgi:hypothetical protein